MQVKNWFAVWMRYAACQALVILSGWISLRYGWGIEVQNWWVVIGVGMFVTFGFYLLAGWVKGTVEFEDCPPTWTKQENSMDQKTINILNRVLVWMGTKGASKEEIYLDIEYMIHDSQRASTKQGE